LAFPSQSVCPIYEQQHWAIEFLFGSGPFSVATTLDRFSAGAQDRSYTNKMPERLDVNDRYRPDGVTVHFDPLRRSTV
jgi:hypothetical protein